MDLNSVDWSNARNLLVKLAQALSPLADNTSSITNTIFLNRRFVPPQHDLGADFYERHPVQILIKLHEVQKQVEELIDDPEAPKETPETRFKNNPKTAASKESAFEVERPKNGASQTPSILPLVRQAKELVHQVQEAIVKLSSSLYIKDPNEAPLRETLKKLKPDLDRIIQTIAEIQRKPAEKGEKISLPIPVPKRQEVVIKKFRELREKNFSAVETEVSRARPQPQPLRKTEPAPENQKAPKAFIQTKLTPDSKPPLPFKEKAEPSTEKKAKEKVSVELETKKLHSKEAKPFQNQIGTLPSEKPEQGQNNTKQEFRPLALPISPLIFDAKRIVSPRKKKKRKGFWFKDEDDTKDA